MCVFFLSWLTGQVRRYTLEIISLAWVLPLIPFLFLPFVFYLCWNVASELVFTLVSLPRIQVREESILSSKAFISVHSS